MGPHLWGASRSRAHRGGCVAELKKSELDFNIFRPDFQAFVLIFPKNGRIVIQEPRDQVSGRLGEQIFNVLRGLFIFGVVVSACLLALFPMRYFVNRVIGFRPLFGFDLEFCRKIVKGHQRLVAMLAEQAVLRDISGE